MINTNFSNFNLNLNDANYNQSVINNEEDGKSKKNESNQEKICIENPSVSRI